MPSPRAWSPTIIHNDYKLNNLVLDPDDLTEVRAVLDWEMATVGDPLFDLGARTNVSRTSTRECAP